MARIILREWERHLPYSIVKESENEEKTLLDFLESTYQAGASLANWDRNTLEG